MNLPLTITYRDMESTPSLESLIAEQTAKLERHCPDMVSCRVTVEAPPNPRHGGHFHVTVDATVPGAEVVASRDPAPRRSHEDCHSAIRDAFRSALRELDRHHEKRRKDRHSDGRSA